MPVARTAECASLGRLKLADALALALCLLLRDHAPGLYERAAARWAARLALEARATRLAVAALQALHGAELDAGADSLSALCEQHGQVDAPGVLERWARARPR